MDNLIIRPAWPQAVPSPQFPFINLDDIPEATIVDYAPVETPSNIHFLEANTDSITMDALTSDCIVPTWGNQELTISHQDFINTVYDAAKNYFCGESVNAPARSAEPREHRQRRNLQAGVVCQGALSEPGRMPRISRLYLFVIEVL